MSQSVPLTKESYDFLQEELKRLIKEERPKVIQDIAEARSHGDLSENAEYDAAKHRQGFIEGRILELQDKLLAPMWWTSPTSNRTRLFLAPPSLFTIPPPRRK